MKNLLPPLSDAEFEALKIDIKKHGVRQPIIVDENDQIIDGHHRAKLDKNAPREIWAGLSNAEKKATAIRLNITRRQLSPAQEKELNKARKQVIEDLLEEGKTQKQVGEWLGITQERISQIVSNISTYTIYDARVTIPKSEYEKIYAMSQNGKSHEKIAANYKVTRPRISQIINTMQGVYDRRSKAPRVTPWKGQWEVDKIYQADVTTLDWLETMPKESIDLIVTDPPYSEKAIVTFEALGRIANKVLKPGRHACIYLGKMFMPELLSILTAWLDYEWMDCVYQPGSQWRIRKAHVYECWRPIGIFKKPGKRFETNYYADAMESKRDKSFHEWQQGLEPIQKMVEVYSRNKELVLEPYCGGGTTPIACLETNRRFLAFDKEENAIKDAQVRIQEYENMQ